MTRPYEGLVVAVGSDGYRARAVSNTEPAPPSRLNVAPGPFLTMRPGGPLEPTVEIHVGTDPGSYRITASWTDRGERREHQERVGGGFDAARERALEIAAALAIGNEP